jgi:ribonuclease R
VLDEKGRILSVAPRERLDAHKLIEDYMIAANVAAAKALEAKKAPVMYRDHEPPSREKLVALKDYLEDLRDRVRARPGDPPRHLQPHHRAGRRGRFPPEIMEQILRTQMQAYYGPKITAISAWRSAPTPTSPARSAATPTSSSTARWSAPTGSARAGCLTDAEAEAMEVIGELISQLERRAMEAERETIDRYVAAYPRRAGRRAGRLPDHRRAAVRLLRHGGGARRRRAGAGLDARHRIFPLRRGEPDPAPCSALKRSSARCE